MPEHRRRNSYTGGRNAAVSRRGFLAAAGAGATIGLAGCLGETDSDDGETVRVVLTPAEAEVDIEDQWQPFFDHIENEVDDVTVDVDVAANFAAVAAAIRDGHADIGDVSPEVGIYTANEGWADIIGPREQDGSDRYFTFITTTPEYDIEELSDIADYDDPSIGFADPLSGTGSLIPLLMLEEAGLDIGGAPLSESNDFRAEFSDHSTARETLLNREEVVAAGTGEFSVMPHLPEDEIPDEVAELSGDYQFVEDESTDLLLVEASDPLPRAPITVRADWDSPVRDEVVDAILAAEEDDLVDPDADEPLWFTGVNEGDVDDYQEFSDALDELDIDFEEVDEDPDVEEPDDA
jgi:phosphonate transport system substrate-binding protein